MLRFTASGQDAPVQCIESGGGCGLVFTARVSCMVVVRILFVDVSDVCHVNKCLLCHKHVSKCTSRHQASTSWQATHVEFRHGLKTMQFATKRESFLKVYQLFI